MKKAGKEMFASSQIKLNFPKSEDLRPSRRVNASLASSSFRPASIYSKMTTALISGRSLRYKFALLLFFAFAALPMCANAQSAYATLNGAVTDPSSAVVPGAVVSLRNIDTGVEKKSQTLGNGTYSIFNILPGQYSITVNATGFQTAARTGVILQVNQTATLNFALSIGSSTETVTVSSDVSTVNSSTAELGTVIGTRQVNDLPLNGRNFTQLLTLTPGVSPIDTGQSASGGGSFSGQAIGTFTFPSVNGQRNRSNMFLLDGVNDLAELGNYNYAPIVDDIQEFKVQSHNDLAEFGGVSGGIINVATRGGTNNIHGSAWEFLRNSALDARNYFQPLVNPLHQNQFGVTVGGPIAIPHLYDGRNKSFFFFAYEGFRQSQAAQTVLFAPTSAELGGDFSALLSQGVTIYNPYSTTPDPANPGQFLRTVFTDNMISPQLLNPAAVLYANTLLPKPQAGVNLPGGGNAVDNTPSRLDQDSFTGRIDETLGPHDTLFGRISYLNEPISQSDGIPGALVSTNIHSWNVAIHETHSFGSTAVIDLYYGRNYGVSTESVTDSNAPSNFPSQLVSNGFSSRFLTGFSNGPSSEIPGVSIPGYSSFGGTTYNLNPFADTNEFGGSFTKVIGRHTLKAGGSFASAGIPNSNANAVEATSAFQTSNLESPNGSLGGGSGDALASFLLGVPVTASQEDETIDDVGGWIDSGYVQDGFQLTPRLTLNGGLRYDIAIWPKPFDGGYYGEPDFGNGTYVLSKVPPPCSSSVGAPCIPGGGGLPAHVVLGGGGGQVHVNDKKNWQGRLGFAFRASTTTSVRGGYGRFYDEWNGILQTSQNFDPWPSLGYLGVGPVNQSTPTVGIGDPLNLGSGAVFQPEASPLQDVGYFNDPALKTPYVDGWNLGIDQELKKHITLTMSYVGSHSSRLMLGGYKNTAEYPGPGDAAVVASRRPFPYMSASPFDQSTGNSNYNALQARLSHTSSAGLMYLISYTWSKSIDLSCSGNYGIEGCELQDAYHPQADRSVSSFDVTHILSGNFVYQLPFGKGQRFALNNRLGNYIIGGWQLNGITTVLSGLPYDVTINGDVANTGNTFVRADLIGSPKLSHPTLNKAINTAAFVSPAPYTFGTTGRNSLRGSWSADQDLSVFRKFPIRDRFNLEFRLEAFNVSNSVFFAVPNNVLNSPTFGSITSMQNTPREVQLGLKAVF
jgi:Carboxypeptidase regulatory-like domain/TonB dependent receptor